jgi:hypothetical protein
LTRNQLPNPFAPSLSHMFVLFRFSTDTTTPLALAAVGAGSPWIRRSSRGPLVLETPRALKPGNKPFVNKSPAVGSFPVSRAAVFSRRTRWERMALRLTLTLRSWPKSAMRFGGRCFWMRLRAGPLRPR